MPSGKSHVPTSQEAQINLFLTERGNIFIDMIHWHERLQEAPKCKFELADWLQDLRDDFYRFSALVRIIRSPWNLSADERAGWEICWNDKVRIIQENITKLIALLRTSPSDWSDDGLATLVLMIAVNIGRLHHERVDLHAGLSSFMKNIHELSRNFDQEDHVPKLEDVWVKMTGIVFCRCKYCMRI